MAKAKVVSVKHMAKGNNKVDIEYLDPIAPKLHTSVLRRRMRC